MSLHESFNFLKELSRLQKLYFLLKDFMDDSQFRGPTFKNELVVKKVNCLLEVALALRQLNTNHKKGP